MPKPYVLVVTGMPGAGKSTFAKALGEAIRMPVLSRDQLKEGYVHSFGKRHSELPGDANRVVTDVFFDALKLLAESRVSVIAEAAFQHRIWAPRLEWFLDKAQVRLLICRVPEEVALARYLQRGLDDEKREYFHGDTGVDAARRGMAVRVDPYEEPRLDVPTFHIDTQGAYRPSIAELAKVILG